MFARSAAGSSAVYAPSGIRTRATTLIGWRPRPLVDWGGGGQNSRERCLHWPGGPVAQLVEQGTFNPKVAGSIPARPISSRLAHGTRLNPWVRCAGRVGMSAAWVPRCVLEISPRACRTSSTSLPRVGRMEASKSTTEPAGASPCQGRVARRSRFLTMSSRDYAAERLNGLRL